jgi:hypothetical protein
MGQRLYIHVTRTPAFPAEVTNDFSSLTLSDPGQGCPGAATCRAILGPGRVPA